jgi:pentatricopeptide repeat protein
MHTSQVLDDMRRKGVPPNLITYTAVISACAKSAGSGYGVYAVDKGMQAMQMMQKDGILPDIITYNALLDACAKAASAGDAFGVERGQRLLRMLRDVGLTPNIITFNTLMHTCAKSSSPENLSAMKEALGVLETMGATGVRPDIVTYNALVDTCARSGQGGLQKAVAVLDDMSQCGLTPDIVTFNSLVNACARAAGAKDSTAFSTAMQILGKMNSSGVEANVVTFNSLMTIISRLAVAGDITDPGAALSQGTQVLGMMLTENLTPNVITFNALVTAIVKSCIISREDCREELMEVFQLMKQVSVQPNSVTFVMVLDGFTAQGLDSVDAGLAAIRMFEEAELEADPGAYKSMIDNCVRTGKKAYAVLPVLKRMEKIGCLPSITTFNSLLAILAKPGEGGCDAGLEYLEFMRNTDVMLNAESFNILGSLRQADEDAGIQPPGETMSPFLDLNPDEVYDEYFKYHGNDTSDDWEFGLGVKNFTGDINNTVPWITIREAGTGPPEDDEIVDFGAGIRTPWGISKYAKSIRKDMGNGFFSRRQPPTGKIDEDQFPFQDAVASDAAWTDDVPADVVGAGEDPADGEEQSEESIELDANSYEP